jgi:hypothetical protein
MAGTDSGQSFPEFVAELCHTDANDPFIQWLRDNKSVLIDWGTFGNEKIRPESRG